MGKGGEGAETYCPAYIVRFVEASTGEELYGEPLDYAPGQEITSAQARSYNKCNYRRNQKVLHRLC